jgi:hypothetical protein
MKALRLPGTKIHDRPAKKPKRPPTLRLSATELGSKRPYKARRAPSTRIK